MGITIGLWVINSVLLIQGKSFPASDCWDCVRQSLTDAAEQVLHRYLVNFSYVWSSLLIYSVAPL